MSIHDRGAHETVEEFDASPYHVRCGHCGAVYGRHPGICRLCGADDLGPIRSLLARDAVRSGGLS